MTLHCLVFLGAPVDRLPLSVAADILKRPQNTVAEVHDARDLHIRDNFSRAIFNPATISYIEYATTLPRSFMTNLIAQSRCFGKAIVIGHGAPFRDLVQSDIALREKTLDSVAVTDLEIVKFCVTKSVLVAEKMDRDRQRNEQGRRHIPPSIFPSSAIVVEIPPTRSTVGV